MTGTYFRCIVGLVPQDAAYMREYRSRNRALYELRLAADRARRRANRRIIAAHPEEFDAILSEERAVEGLPPIGVLKPGPKPKSAAA